MAFPKRKHGKIAGMMFTSGQIANFYPLGHFLAPSKDSCVRIVVKYVADMLRRKADDLGFHVLFPTYVSHKGSIA